VWAQLEKEVRKRYRRRRRDKFI